MVTFANVADRMAIEAEAEWAERGEPRSIHALLSRTKAQHDARPAVSFQLFSSPDAAAQTLTWAQLHGRVTQSANMLRALGVGPTDVVAYVLPNCLETVEVLLGGMVAGIVLPISPLLKPDQMAAILREAKVKVVVTLKSFPKAEVAQLVAAAVAQAPCVESVLEVDLNRYVSAPKSWIVPFMRPKVEVRHHAKLLNYGHEIVKYPSDHLQFEDDQDDRVAAYFHTGGTTGLPKVAQHRVSGMIYNGWLGARLIFRSTDVLLCPLPLFHVLAVYPILMSMVSCGGHVVYPTPAGYRGKGVFDNLWKLVERWKCSYLITVPTALAALMQRLVNADISSLRGVFSGSSPLPLELLNRFERISGVQVIEGYGLTEATCLVACNPPEGMKKVGSVGLPLPHSHVRILQSDSAGNVLRECGVDEVGEICVSNPGVFPGSIYTERDKNHRLFAEGTYLRTGDLGRLDEDGYLFITGRAKDLIIRGGHNIDPASIEEVLMSHEAVAFVGAIGQPDPHSGELPCAYIELIKGATLTSAELIAFAQEHISERAAVPKYIEIIEDMPKTAVGKVFKPALRRLAISRVFDAALRKAGLDLQVVAVIEDKKRGLVAQIGGASLCDDAQIAAVLDGFTTPWERVRG